MFDPKWSERDKLNYKLGATQFDDETTMLDGVVAGFKEGWEAGPTQSIINLIESSKGRKYMTPAEANEKYGLTGTPAAFKDGEELISDNHAQHVADRHLERERNESIIKRVEEDHGALGSLANFGGNLIAGAVDPTNLAVGIGTAAATARAGAMVGSIALREVSKRTLSETVAVQLAENFVVSAATEAALVPISDSVMNQETSIERVAYNVIGSTLMGGALGTVMEGSTNAAARWITNKASRQHGSQTAEIIAKVKQLYGITESKGVKPNHDHVIKVQDRMDYATRPDQKAYVFKELTTPEDIKSRVYHIGKDDAKIGMDHVSFHGANSIVLTDNYNLAHNRVSSLDGKKTGEVFEVTINENTRILGQEDFDAIKADLAAATIAEFEAQGIKFKGNFDEATSVAQMKEAAYIGIDDFKNVDSLDDIINNVIEKAGFDGYHFLSEASTLENTQYNGIALFRKAGQESGTIQSKTSGTHNYDNRLMNINRSIPTTKFDPSHANAEAYLKPIQDLEKAEIQRQADVTEQQGYDKAAKTELDSQSEPPPVEQYDSAKDLLEREAGLTPEKIKAIAGEEGEQALKVLDGEQQMRKEANQIKEICGMKV